jgi:ABC-type transport system substrate-binding protein
MNSKRLALFAGIVVVGLTAAACAPAAQPTPASVEKIVQVTVPPVEKIVEVTAPPETVRIEATVEVPKGAFSTPNPKLADVRVRQALAYCSDRLELIKSVYALLPEAEQRALIANSFIPNSHWAYAGDENLTLYPFDAEKGKRLLDEAGWKQPEGAPFRVNDKGDELFFKFTTTSAVFRQTWAAVWEQQMANCGVRIIRQHVPGSWWFGDTTGTARRDFELGAWAWTGQPDPGGQSLYACDQIPLPENAWVGQNGMGWCNEAASQAIKDANNSLDRKSRIADYAIVQREFTRDMVSLPLFARTNVFAVNPNLTGFDPKIGDENFNYNIAEWEIPGKDTIVLGWTQEPASMWLLVEQAQVAIWAYGMVGGYQWLSPNYDYTPAIQEKMSTIENNLATNADVEVKEGDRVQDATGKPITLTNGVMIRNSAGEVVEFNGTPVMMKQLNVKLLVIKDLKWSDGEPVKKADFELGFNTDCNRDAGATTYIVCDQVQAVTFLDTGFDVTYLPGAQPSTYFAMASPFVIYPSHRVIESDGEFKGKKLAEVPVKAWATLPEIAERPIDVGPYVVKEWVKGEKIVYEANPFYYKGAPKTRNIVISIITPENAEAQLIGGQVDVLDFTTLTALTEQLAAAEKDGKVRNIVLASGTWEHIDFNLYLP